MGVSRSAPPCGSYLLAPLIGNKEGSKGFMVLRVKFTPTRFPINNLYTSMDNTPLHSKYVPPVGRLAVFATSLKCTKDVSKGNPRSSQP